MAKLDEIDWAKIGVAEARRLIGPANCREHLAAQVWDANPTDENEAAWKAAMQLEEDLRVFAICGVRPGQEK